MTEEFMKVAQKAEIPEGAVKVYSLVGQEIAICNVAGQCYAIADLCSHDNGPLGEGELVDNEIECPRHGARFDVKTGKALCLPAVKPIPCYELEERNGDIWVKPKAQVRA